MGTLCLAMYWVTWLLIFVGSSPPKTLAEPSFIVNWAVLHESLIFMGDDPSVSEGCRAQAQIFRDGLEQNNLTVASLTMLDATGKLPSGIGQGNSYSMGSYEECVQLLFKPDDGETFQGKYCTGSLQPNLAEAKEDDNDVFGSIMASSYSGVTWGVCLPEACSAHDINAHVKTVMTGMSGGVIRANFKD